MTQETHNRFGLVEETLLLCCSIGSTIITLVINPFYFEPTKLAIFSIAVGLCCFFIITLFFIIFGSPVISCVGKK
jgi:hypothetical protein